MEEVTEAVTKAEVSRGGGGVEAATGADAEAGADTETDAEAAMEAAAEAAAGTLCHPQVKWLSSPTLPRVLSRMRWLRRGSGTTAREFFVIKIAPSGHYTWWRFR
jgi:hypothetical protein